MESIRQDIRQALRMMWAHKAFTTAALLTLALGIGANAAVFSMVYGVLLRPLPYPEPDRLMRVSELHPGAVAPFTGSWISDQTIDSWTPIAKTIEPIAAYRSETYTVGRDQPVRLGGAAVAPSLFGLLRVRPAAGRFFETNEALAGADGLVVLTYDLWQERFGGRADAIGQTIQIDDRSHVIVGVTPPGFAYPTTETKLFVPLVMPTRNVKDGQSGLSVLYALTRLKPGVTPEQAVAEGTAAARSQPRSFVADMLFGKGGPVEVRVRPVVDELTMTLKPALLVLMAGVALVLLVACANVANLFLARGQARQRELAVRAALGAGWGRLARQLLAESLVFAIAGGLLGLFLAWVLVRTLPAVAPESFPRIDDVQLDGRVLAFGLLASIVSGLLAGVLPAFRGAQAGLEPSLRAGDRRATSASGRGLRAGLLMLEAALAVVLVVGAGLLVRSFIRLTQVDGGFDARNVLAVQIFLPKTATADTDAAMTKQFYDTLLPRLDQMPGVVATGVGNMAPFMGRMAIMGFRLPTPGPDGKPQFARASAWWVTPGYAGALGLTMKQGRFFEPGDLSSATQVMAVNEEFVKQYLNDGRPVVGRMQALGDPKNVSEIVGVVQNVLKVGLDRAPEPELYMLSGRGGRALPRQAVLLVRTKDNPTALIPDLRRLAREADPRAALDGLAPLADELSASVAQPRFAALMLALFAGLALAVAATGLYGVLSYNVSERRREIGVRAALGATRGALIGLVLRQGLGFTLGGLLLGLVFAALAARLLSGLLFGVTPYDALAYAIAPATLLLVALVACIVPAWRAAATDPTEALRAE